VWWHTPVIPVLEKWRQEDQEFKASLNFFETVSEKKKNINVPTYTKSGEIFPLQKS
jgi:hypothetical protein